MSYTRGVKKLKQYLGSEEQTLSRAKTAKDVATVLLQKKRLQTQQQHAGEEMQTAVNAIRDVNAEIDANNSNSYNVKRECKSCVSVNLPLAPSVLHYLSEHCVTDKDNTSPVINKISKKQMLLIHTLGEDVSDISNNSTSPNITATSMSNVNKEITVKRACLHNVNAIADTLALSALQRANAGANNGLEQSAIFVLVEDIPAALTLRRRLVTCYKMHVLLLSSEEEKAQYASLIAQEVQQEIEAENDNESNAKITSNNNTTTTNKKANGRNTNETADTNTSSVKLLAHTKLCNNSDNRERKESVNTNTSKTSKRVSEMSIVNTDRFPTYPYAKKIHKTSPTPSLPRSPVSVSLSKSSASFHTATTPTHNTNKTRQSSRIANIYKNEQELEIHDEVEDAIATKEKVIEEPVVIVLATPGVMTTVDKRSAL